MLKTLDTKSAKPRKGRVRVDGDSRARRNGSQLNQSGIDNIKVNGDEVEDNKVRKKDQKTSKSKKTVGSNFFTLRTRLAFTKLR